MNVLYVANDATARAGRLVDSVPSEGHGTTALVSRRGAPLAPTEVGALLALPGARESRRAALLRAHRAGYRVEEA